MKTKTLITAGLSLLFTVIAMPMSARAVPNARIKTVISEVDADGQVRVLMRPTCTTPSGKRATFEMGDFEYVLTANIAKGGTIDLHQVCSDKAKRKVVADVRTHCLPDKPVKTKVGNLQLLTSCSWAK